MTYKEALDKFKEDRINALKKLEKEPKNIDLKDEIKELDTMIKSLQSIESKDGVEVIMINELRKKHGLEEIDDHVCNTYFIKKSSCDKYTRTFDNFDTETGQKNNKECPMCWIKNEPYDCSMDTCPGIKLHKIELEKLTQ